LVPAGVGGTTISGNVPVGTAAELTPGDVAGTMISGRRPVEPRSGTIAGLPEGADGNEDVGGTVTSTSLEETTGAEDAELTMTGCGSITDSRAGEEVGWRMEEGRTPVGATKVGICAAGVSSGCCSGSSGLGVETGDEATLAFEASLDDSGRELDGGGGGADRTTSSGEEELDATGAGGCCIFPVPERRSLRSGVAVTMISCVEVKVLVGSNSLTFTAWSEEDEESWGPVNMDSTNDLKSGNWRDSSFSEELLDDKDEDVGAAGAVMLVTIWRLTCRGK
jgi:hypothetical protein